MSIITNDCAQIQRTNGLWYSVEYSTFTIANEVGKYQLTVDGYSGDADNAFDIAYFMTYLDFLYFTIMSGVR